MGDTKLLGTRNNFEEIDEAQNSESKESTHKNYLEDREQSNTSLERDIINISAIVDRKELNRKKILENISFSSSIHDIYNPEWSTSHVNTQEESVSELELGNDDQDTFLKQYNITEDLTKEKRKPSPIRIRRKPKIKQRLLQDTSSKDYSFLSRNLSQNKVDEKSTECKQPRSKLIIVNSK